MAKRSAGLLLYRRSRPNPEVLLLHPGGPFWISKDDGAWSIPKGLIEGTNGRSPRQKDNLRRRQDFFRMAVSLSLADSNSPAAN